MANTATYPAPFVTGFRLIDGNDLNKNFATRLTSAQGAIVPTSGGGKANAFQITATLNHITTVAAPADSIILPPSAAGLQILIENDGANPMQVFGFGTDVINGIATATGFSQAAGSFTTYTCVTKGFWRAVGSINAGGTGTFTANGASAVVVADASITANSVIVYGLKTIGGTPAGAPFESAVTAGTGFSVKAVAGDTSIYNYTIIG